MWSPINATFVCRVEAIYPVHDPIALQDKRVYSLIQYAMKVSGYFLQSMVCCPPCDSPVAMVAGGEDYVRHSLQQGRLLQTTSTEDIPDQEGVGGQEKEERYRCVCVCACVCVCVLGAMHVCACM